MGIKHAFVNPKADGGDATITRPSDWNATHAWTEPVTATTTNNSTPLTVVAPESGGNNDFAIRIVPAGLDWTGALFISTGDPTQLTGDGYAIRVMDENGRQVFDLDSFGSMALQADDDGGGGMSIQAADFTNIMHVVAALDRTDSRVDIDASRLHVKANLILDNGTPPDSGDLSAGDVGFSFDDTDGNPQLHLKAKTADGTVVSTDLWSAAAAVAEGRSNNTFEMAWISPGNGYLSMGTAALGADTTYYNPILVSTSITIDRIAVEVTSAGAGGKVTRLGIYNADTSWQPTSLLLDAGTVVADATGVKAATVNQVLAAGRYLLVCNSNGTPTLRTARTDSRYMGMAAAIGSSAFFARAATTGQAIATTAYPGTGAAWSNYTGSSVGFDNNVFVRVSTP